MSLIALFLCWADFAYGGEIILKRYLTSKKALTEAKAIDINGIRVSKKCVNHKGIPSCMAWVATRKKSTGASSSGVPLIGHPAAKNCKSHNGVSLIFLDTKNNEVDYCLFKDDSFVNSWDLYHANNKN